jgi:putative GTP pyrophosphokinase
MDQSPGTPLDAVSLPFARQLRDGFDRLVMEHQFAVDEVMTKVSILQREFMHLSDIAGLRITCSFIADTYRVLDALTSQDDLTVLSIKDYIAQPKPNGYKSLHAILEVPVFLSDGPVPVKVEVQVRTIAMDFWASLEHKIYYKYDGEVPHELVDDLTEAARVAQQLDERMAKLHGEIHGSAEMTAHHADAVSRIDGLVLQRLLAQSSGPEPRGT